MNAVLKLKSLGKKIDCYEGDGEIKSLYINHTVHQGAPELHITTVKINTEANDEVSHNPGS